METVSVNNFLYTMQVFNSMHGVITSFFFGTHSDSIEIRMQKEHSVIKKLVTTAELFMWNTDFTLTILESMLREINKKAELENRYKEKEWC